MELIIIKGKSNIGKTTIATIFHNRLAQIERIKLKWMEYDSWLLPLEEKDLFYPNVPDFRSVFLYKEKLIGIVSHGDSVLYAKQFIRQMMNEFNVDVLIVCSNVEGKNWDMLNRDFGKYIKDENIFEVSSDCWTEDRNNRIIAKECFVDVLIKHLNQIM